MKKFTETMSFNSLRQEDGTGGSVDSNAALSAGSAAANLNLRERLRLMSTDFVGSAGYVIGLWGSSMMAQARDSKSQRPSLAVCRPPPVIQFCTQLLCRLLLS